MSQLSPRLGLPFMQPAQAQKHVTHNEALQRLDAATQLQAAFRKHAARQCPGHPVHAPFRPAQRDAEETVWTAAQAVNFTYVPVKFRPLFGSCVALWWNIYLSLSSAKGKPSPAVKSR